MLQNCHILFAFFSNWDVNWSIIDRYTIYNYQRKSGGTGYDYKVDKSSEEEMKKLKMKSIDKKQ